MGQTLVEAGEAVGCAWPFAWLVSVMLMLAAEQMLMAKRYRRNVLRKISSANGCWLKDMGMWRSAKFPPQMVGCWMRSGAGISVGRFRVQGKGDPLKHPGQPAPGRDKTVSGVQAACARGQGRVDRLYRRHRETLDPASPS
jgi:hypothetical protein